MIKHSGFEISSMRYMAVRGQSWLVRLPLLRELAMLSLQYS